MTVDEECLFRYIDERLFTMCHRTRARRLVETFGGRFSVELGIDLAAGGAAADQWFLASTLFGTRISAQTAMRTYRVLNDAGIGCVTDVRDHPYDELVALLDAGGYARYDFRTATRLRQLANAVLLRFAGSVACLATVTDPREVEKALDALPGWGPTTVRVFLRELRDVWPGARPSLDDRTVDAARHLAVPISGEGVDQVEALRTFARRAHLDLRDLEAALVRLALVHRDIHTCPVAQPRRVAPDWPVLDGPASRALDAWLRPLLPDGLVRCRREDYGTPPATAATVRYRSPMGGHVSVLRCRLTCPLLLDVFCDAKQRAVVRIRPTGTEVIRTDDDGEHRLMMVRPDGTLLLVESIGLPAAGIKTPIPSEQLDQLELLLDRPSRDLDIEEAADTLP